MRVAGRNRDRGVGRDLPAPVHAEGLRILVAVGVELVLQLGRDAVDPERVAPARAA